MKSCNLELTSLKQTYKRTELVGKATKMFSTDVFVVEKTVDAELIFDTSDYAKRWR